MSHCAHQGCTQPGFLFFSAHAELPEDPQSVSGNKIPHERLEALPFTRYTVECQERIEKGLMGGGRWGGVRQQRSIFGLDDASTSSADTADDDTDSLDKD